MNEEMKSIEVQNEVLEQPPIVEVKVGLIEKCTSFFMEFKTAIVVGAILAAVAYSLMMPATAPAFVSENIEYYDHSSLNWVKDLVTRGPALERVYYNPFTRKYMALTTDGRTAITKGDKWVIREQQ